MSENSDATIPVQDDSAVDSNAVDLRARPYTHEAFQYLKGTGLVRHLRWDWAVNLATAMGRQITLEEAEILATAGGQLTCSNPNCKRVFDEPNVMVIRFNPDPSADPIPDLPPEISARVARKKNGNILYQGATRLVPDGNGREAALPFCGSLYYNRINADGTVSPVWDRNSCLGMSMYKAKAKAEGALTEEEKKAGAKVTVALPLEFTHADAILRAKDRSQNRDSRRREEEERAVAARRAEAKAETDARREGMNKVYSYGPGR